MFNFLKKKNKQDFRVVALITMYNEELFIERCLNHLIQNGIECYIVDNASTDRSLALAKKFLNKGVIKIDTLPRNGCYDLAQILENKQKIAKMIDADWFINQDVDEIRMPPLPYKTLKEAIYDIDLQGYNAINFDEFVFMPTVENNSFEEKDFVKEMEYYYFFEPYKNRQIKAWKKNETVDIVNSGGHKTTFEGIKVYPNNFILRHYIALSKEHVVRKYCKKKFTADALKRGWHGERAIIKPGDIAWPSQKNLKKYNHDRVFNKSEPWNKHFLFRNLNHSSHSKTRRFSQILGTSWAFVKQVINRIIHPH